MSRVGFNSDLLTNRLKPKLQERKLDVTALIWANGAAGIRRYLLQTKVHGFYDMNADETVHPQLKISRVNLDTGRENVVVISRRSSALRPEVFRGFSRVELRRNSKKNYLQHLF